MSLRAKLVIIFSFILLVCVGLVAWVVSDGSRRAFETLYQERTTALVEQFRREFDRRAQDVNRTISGITEAESVLLLAVAVGRGDTLAPFVNEATPLAAAHNLDFLALVGDDGAIISSAHWPARFGYQEGWLLVPNDWREQGAFLKREELPDGPALALVAVRELKAGERSLYIVGGRRLDREFLASLVLPSGMRALLYRNFDQGFTPDALSDATGPLAQADKLAPLVRQVQLQRLRREPDGISQTIQWTSDPASAEVFHAIPLRGRGAEELLGIFLVGSSQAELVALQRQLRFIVLVVVAGGLLLAVILSSWAAARVSRPLEKLAAAATEVAAGNWNAQVDVNSRGEIGQLAASFNAMTRELLEQRERLVQTERVAAWRELARRLAHELKNPLFPLQITIENLLRARHLGSPQQFDDVFHESTRTLLAELANLKTIVSRFSDFARMPAPQLRAVQINQLLEHVAKLAEAQVANRDGNRIEVRLALEENLALVPADPDLLYRAVQNLVLNAIDAMPGGGILTLRSAARADAAIIEVSDTGAGLTREECERLFTPYYTTRDHGTGLGLAIVQSVVSDHGGKVTVESRPGSGASFRILIPRRARSDAAAQQRAGVMS